MRKDKVKAFELRRQGKSYSEITKVLGTSKGTLASWFKNESWSKELRDKLGASVSMAHPKKLASIIKANKIRWSGIHQSYRDEAEKEFIKLKKDPLFLSGVMLYWGEGEKTAKSSALKFTSNDPQMIRVFYNFLEKTLKVPNDKIKAYLLLYPDLNESMQKSFWSKAAGIPIDRFWNSIFIDSKKSKKRLSYGTCNLRIDSRELKEKMLTWINLFQKDLA